MQDIGGLRAVVSSLQKVRALERNYRSSKFKHELHTSYDYIENPKPSGYRSIHLVYKYRNLTNDSYDGLFIELQIRTRVQHAWASAVETMGTYLNHSLKSSEGPEKWLSFFSLVGSALAHMEGTNPVPGYEKLSKISTYNEVVSQMEELGVIDKLMAFSVATQHITTDKKKGSFHLIKLDFIDKRVTINNYSKDELDKANKDYAKVESEIAEGASLQAVLVSTGSIKNLRKAYPSYFLDTRDFIKHLNKIKTESYKKV